MTLSYEINKAEHQNKRLPVLANADGEILFVALLRSNLIGWARHHSDLGPFLLGTATVSFGRKGSRWAAGEAGAFIHDDRIAGYEFRKAARYADDLV